MSEKCHSFSLDVTSLYVKLCASLRERVSISFRRRNGEFNGTRLRKRGSQCPGRWFHEGHKIFPLRRNPRLIAVRYGVRLSVNRVCAFKIDSDLQNDVETSGDTCGLRVDDGKFVK